VRTVEIERRKLYFWAGYVALILLGMLIFGKWVPEGRYRANAVRSKENLHAVQIALERFAVDQPTNAYPQSIQQVIDAGYMEQLPINPFSGEPMRYYEPPASEIPAKGYYETGLPQLQGFGPGDFLYQRRYMDGQTEGEVVNYTLYLY